MEKRKKNRSVKIRMDEEDFARFTNLVNQSGLSKQLFLELMIDEVQMPTKEDTYALMEIEARLREISQILRADGNNLNQMAKVANASGQVHFDKYEMEALEIVLEETQGGLHEIWQSLKPLIAKRTAKQH